MKGLSTGTGPTLLTGSAELPAVGVVGARRLDRSSLADATDSRAAQAFGLSSFPYFVALDSENRVVARASGELTVEQWEAPIDEARS